jgi:hypothetical protein
VVVDVVVHVDVAVAELDHFDHGHDHDLAWLKRDR